MNLSEPPRAEIRSFGPSPEDMDSLLNNFFRSELPRPWPALSSPKGLPPGPPRAGKLFGSRFALAASILFLLLSTLWLSGMFRGTGAGSPQSDPAKQEATKRRPQAEPPAAAPGKSTQDAGNRPISGGKHR